MKRDPLRLLLITPCRDESKFIDGTIRSVINQTHRPARWLIVDDGSRDGTREIAARLAADHPWMEVMVRNRSGSRELGPGVVATFNAGLAHLDNTEYDVIAKLDGDLEFDPDCFARVLAHFDNPRVGMSSGTVFLVESGKPVHERHTTFHVTGAAKFYRRECFRDIGGLRPIYGWDILDETDARRLGWITISDPTVMIRHHRLQGAALGVVRGRVVWGMGAYAIGSHPAFALGRACYRMFERPWLIGGLAFLWGFVASYFKKDVRRNDNPESVRYLRREQIHRLFHRNEVARYRSNE